MTNYVNCDFDKITWHNKETIKTNIQFNGPNRYIKGFAMNSLYIYIFVI